MKTIALSTLVLFAFACAPEANDASEDIRNDMDESTEAALDEAFSRNEDDKNRFIARQMLRDLRADIKDDGCTVIGTVGGAFSDTEQYFKAVGFGHRAQPILDITGDFTWTDGPDQRRILDGEFTGLETVATAVERPDEGDFTGGTDDNTYTAIQLADGFTPLYHEGAWVEMTGTGEGYFIGLISHCE
jgi:hypothetical protein